VPTVADALRQHADDYLTTFANRMPAEHKRVLAAITRCRTGDLGHLRYQCCSCRRVHWVGRSCGNRHCPNCQSDKTQVWLAKRTAQLLPVPYFLVTFTVPRALRKIVRANQRDCYQALFDAGSQTLRELASGPRFIGTDRLGFFGELHTWGRDFTVYQPPLATSSLAATILAEFLHAARRSTKGCKQDLTLNSPGSLNKECELRLLPSLLNARTPPTNALPFTPQSRNTRSQILSCYPPLFVL